MCQGSCEIPQRLKNQTENTGYIPAFVCSVAGSRARCFCLLIPLGTVNVKVHSNHVRVMNRCWQKHKSQFVSFLFYQIHSHRSVFQMESPNKCHWFRVYIKVIQGAVQSSIKHTFQNRCSDANMREEDREVEQGKQTEPHPHRSLLECVKHFRKARVRSLKESNLKSSIWLTNLSDITFAKIFILNLNLKAGLVIVPLFVFLSTLAYLRMPSVCPNGKKNTKTTLHRL